MIEKPRKRVAIQPRISGFGAAMGISSAASTQWQGIPPRIRDRGKTMYQPANNKTIIPENYYNLENRQFNKQEFEAELQLKEKRRRDLQQRTKYGQHFIESIKQAGQT